MSFKDQLREVLRLHDEYQFSGGIENPPKDPHTIDSIVKLVEEEIIGKDDIESVDGNDIRHNPPYSYRNYLRAIQRNKLKGADHE